MSHLNLNGIGKNNGGVYESVNINGVYSIVEDLQCESFEGTGTLKAETIIATKSFQLEGTLKLQKLKAKRAEILGVFKCLSEINCDELKGSGIISIEGNTKGDLIDLQGKIKLLGSTEAEKIKLEIDEKSSFVEISASEVIIRKSLNDEIYINLSRLPTRKNQPLVTGDLVEGENIYLEYCKIRSVYGDRIEIGPNCEIDEIEYKETLTIHPTAMVMKQKKI